MFLPQSLSPHLSNSPYSGLSPSVSSSLSLAGRQPFHEPYPSSHSILDADRAEARVVLGNECTSLPTRAICPPPGHQPSLPLPAPQADSLNPRFPGGLKSNCWTQHLQGLPNPHMWEWTSALYLGLRSRATGAGGGVCIYSRGGLEASALLTPLHTGPFFVPLLTQIDSTLHLLEGAGDSPGAGSRGLQAPAL